MSKEETITLERAVYVKELAQTALCYLDSKNFPHKSEDGTDKKHAVKALKEMISMLG